MGIALCARAAARLSVIPIALAGALFSQSADASLLIDDFTSTSFPSQWPVVLNAPGSTSVTETALGPSVLGGVRTTTLTAEAAGDGPMNMLAAAGAGIFDFITNNNTQGTVTFLYDAGNGAASGLGVNMSGQVGILIDFTLFDTVGGQPMPVRVSINDGTSTATLLHSVTAPGVQSIVYSFDSFAGIGGVNLESVTSIEVELSPVAGADFRLNRISTIIPAPGALALLGLGGLTLRRRRRN